MPTLQPPKTVLIVGGGVFGSATALQLLKGPYKNHGELITILDRSATPPAADAASYDYNKIVRQEYSDPLYGRLAHDAMVEWRKDEWNRNYHEVGVVVSVGKNARQSDYISKALASNSQPGMETPGLEAYILDGDFTNQHVYINEAGGWAHSRGAVVDTNQRNREQGVNFEAGEAVELVYERVGEQVDVKGVVTSDRREFRADFVILCAGSWTPLILPELGNELLPTGQVAGAIQLTPDELERYRDVPVTRLIDNGFYIFPPNPDGIMKFAIHQKGYLNPMGGLPSLPRTALTVGYENQRVPPSAEKALRIGLARIYPELAKRHWVVSRLCWYSDRPSGDWLIDYHERYKSLFIAAGCCGHAFKFMPIIGELVVKAIEGELTSEQADIWAFNHRKPGRVDGSRTFSQHMYLEPQRSAFGRL